MLRDLNADQARFIALLAKNARTERDGLLGNAGEDELGEPHPARGEHNLGARLGFEPLPPEASQTAALREALNFLSRRARHELYTLMLIGQGRLAARQWYRGLSEAELLGDEGLTAMILEDADLHDHIAKGLYQTRLSPRK